MDEEYLIPNMDPNVPKKRKWSPQETYSESPTIAVPDLSGDHDESSSDHTLTAEASYLGVQTSHKRFKVNSLEPHFRSFIDPVIGPRYIPEDRSHLPPEVWQHVFRFVPPTSLGRLLRVSRIFNTLLTPSSALPPAQIIPAKFLTLQDQDHVWAMSRKLFHASMPRPMSSQTELEIWRLITGRSCQFCERIPSTSLSSPGTAPWSSGPGPDTVRIIWPFAVRTCSLCLSARILKETDLLFSPSSALIPALPFAFFTPSLNFVASVTIRNGVSPPPGIQLTKYYFRPQLDDIKVKMDDVRSLGNAAAEEWYKGLEESRQKKLADASRWEQWEITGGVRQLLKSRHEHDLIQSSSNEQFVHRSAVPSVTQDRPQTGSTGLKPLPNLDTRTITSVKPLVSQGAPASLPPKPTTPASQYNFSHHMQPQISMPTPIQPHVPRPRVERSIRDVTEMKANRRAEIEKRCLELSPPILASTLVYMDSFAAAIQIPMTLTDNAWEVLKPRLLAQRGVAEVREQEQRNASQVLQAKTEERRLQEAQLKEARETLDREWEEMQRPVREKVNLYADEIITLHWRNGEAVTKDTCAQFAADVLMYVRKRFYDVQAQEDATLTNRGIPIPQDLPNEAPTRKLTLENMKWVFEAKIKPLTERHRREIFLCSVCDNSLKYYALDAVIQHYAAKHTSALSMGTAVVYWRADWPEEPPFNPNPSAAKLISNLPTSAMSTTGPGDSDATIPYGVLTGGYYPPAEHVPYQSNDRAYMYPPTSPESRYLHSYAGHNLMPQSAPHPTSPLGSNYRMIHSGNLSYGQQPQIHAPPPRPYEIIQNQYHPPTASPFSPFQRSSFPAPYSESDLRPVSSLSHVSHPGPYQPSNNSFPQQARVQAPLGSGRQFQPGPPGQPFGIYQVQIEELARNARNIWNGTSGIRDLPNSVRVKVIIHHVVLRFANKFTNEPNLALFTDALNNNSQMKPLRDLDGLLCKACTSSEDLMGSFQNYPSTFARDKVLHSLPALLAHFQSAHVEHGRPNMIPQTGIEIPRPEWKFDMVELPERSVIMNLMYSPGIDFSKLSLIATVLPSYFPSPLPRIEPVPDINDVVDVKTEEIEELHGRHLQDGHGDGLQSQSQRAPTANMQEHLPRVRSDGLEVTVDNFPKFVDSPMHDAPQPIEPAGEDEYDPHRPAYVQPDRIQPAAKNFPRSLPRRELGNSFHSESIDTNAAYTDIDRSYRPSSVTRFTVDHARDFRVRPAFDSPRHVHQIHQMDNLPSVVTYTSRHGQTNTPDDRVEPYLPRRLVQLIPAENASSSEMTKISRHDAKASPRNESMSAAEQFLNEFDPTGDGISYPDQDRSSRHRSESVQRVKWPAETQPLNAGQTIRDLPNEPNPQNGWHGRARSPLRDSRHLQEDTRYAVESEGYVQRARVSVPDAAGSHYSHGEFQALDTRYTQELPNRQSQGRFDGYGSDRDRDRDGSQHPQTISPATLEPLPADSVFYRERDAGPRQQQRHVYAPSSPETFQVKRPVDEMISYTRTAPTRQYRYVDDPRYDDAVYTAPVEYIRVASLDSQAPERYYVERSAPRSQADEYVEYDGEYRREQEVLDHNGQVYARDQDPQDPYVRHARYH